MFRKRVAAGMTVAAVCLMAPLSPLSSASAAACGLGYIERYDRKGESICVSAAHERTRALERRQAMRALQSKWRESLEGDRQALRMRTQLAQQNR